MGINVLKKIITSALVCSALVSTVSATASASASASVPITTSAHEHEFGFGFGTEYGLVLGAQYAYRTEGKRYKFGLGIGGMSIGAEAKFEQYDSLSYGITAGYSPQIFSDGGITYIGPTWHYYFSGFDSNSFVFSAGLVAYHEELGTNDESRQNWFNPPKTDEQGVIGLLSVGYKF